MRHRGEGRHHRIGKHHAAGIFRVFPKFPSIWIHNSSNNNWKAKNYLYCNTYCVSRYKDADLYIYN